MTQVVGFDSFSKLSSFFFGALAMSEVLLFNHIPKTAGSTLKHVFWRLHGGSSVAFAMGFHDRRLGELRPKLIPREAQVAVVIAHTGFGLHERLPSHHRYPMITFLRDPVERTISSYFFHLEVGRIAPDTSFLDFLEHDVGRSYNVQTAFLGGLHVRQHLDGLNLTRSQFDSGLLARARRNLRAHAVVGLTERFDESLLLLQRTFGWSRFSLLHRRENVGGLKASRRRLTQGELGAVRANNELDMELYQSAVDLFEQQLQEHVPHAARRLATFRRLNTVYARCYPVLYPPARSLLGWARAGRG